MLIRPPKGLIMSTKQAQKLAYWKELILKQELSNQSVLKFCQAQQVSSRVFYYYRGLLKTRTPQTSATSSKSSAFVAIKTKSTESSRSLPDPKWLAQFSSELIRSLS
jgi:hypothetical protein